MGDRAVAGFRKNASEPTIFIYQHWVAGAQEEVLAQALDAARPRWGDDSYATRICLSQIVGDQWNSETGFGIYVGATSHGADYSHILIVEWDSRQVIVADNDNSDREVARIDFETFISNPTMSVADESMDFQQEKQAEWEAKWAEFSAS